MPLCSVYINLSGGVDSTYYLWRWLKENPDKKILVHHCLLNDARREVEKTASDNILNYLKANGLTNFRYCESTFNRKGIKGSIADLIPIAFMSGVILRNRRLYPQIKEILLSYCYEETPIIRNHLKLGKSIRELNTIHRTRRFMDIIELTSQRSFNFVIPFMDKTKADMIEEMPEELFKLTWFCRSPVNGQPCLTCFNCKRVLKINTAG
jgi:hypothetical protein